MKTRMDRPNLQPGGFAITSHAHTGATTQLKGAKFASDTSAPNHMKNELGARIAVSVLLVTLMPCTAWSRPACTPIDPARDGSKILNAVEQGAVARMVHCGLNINVDLLVGGAHITPLQMAVFTGKPTLVQQVLALGADPNQADGGFSPRPPLELALSQRHYSVAADLMRSGARASYVLQPTGMTALMTAAFDQAVVRENKSILTQLLEQGADVNAHDIKSQTPLHWAAKNGNADYVQWLIENGSPPCSRDARGRQAHEVIAKNSPDFNTIKASLIKACLTQDDL